MENYKRNEKGFIDIKIEELYVYEDLVGEGCIAANKITKDGYHVGYMYRDEHSEAYPDSGWRFFAGDESSEYSNEPENFNIFSLNTICNYDEAIIKYLDAPIGTYLIRINEDEFIVDDEQSEIFMSKMKEEK